jgi:2-succinyl-5-enolpyruvyl-6-hydroxy-3-cyclohexene-1-carboxylate synthase
LELLAKQFTHDKRDILTDGSVFYRLSTIIPSSIPIFLSNSLPVRDQELFAPMWSIDNPLIAQRGAAGIDGISSTALGVSLSTNLPMALITGDIAFLYDINALLSAKLITQPLVIFVINNGGGSIFSSLPIQQVAPESMEWFLTPQQVSIEHLAQGYGLSYTKITHSKQLWETNWAELVKNVLRTNTLTSENNNSRAKQFNVRKPDKLNPSQPTSTNSASSVRIVEFITNSQASIAERNQFRQ